MRRFMLMAAFCIMLLGAADPVVPEDREKENGSKAVVKAAEPSDDTDAEVVEIMEIMEILNMMELMEEYELMEEFQIIAEGNDHEADD